MQVNELLLLLRGAKGRPRPVPLPGPTLGVSQEQTLIKIEVQNPLEQECLKPHADVLKGMKVILPAATLRPETMFGQTNCWILPEGEYSAYQVCPHPELRLQRDTACCTPPPPTTKALCQPPPPPPPAAATDCDCLTNVVRHDVLFSVSDTVCVLRFNQVWHRE